MEFFDGYVCIVGSLVFGTVMIIAIIGYFGGI